MPKTVTAAQMARIDLLARDRYGIPSIILMENAGRSSAEEIYKDFSRRRRDPQEAHSKKLHAGKKGKAAVFCGKGQNGGDGFVCARYLKESGIKTIVFILGRCRDIKKRDPLINLAILKNIGARIIEVASKKDAEKIKKNFDCDFIVDAIFGIGFRGCLPGEIADIVDFLNNTRKPIYALDVPSGLDATTGTVRASCIKAHKTITFGLPKRGFSRKEARRYLGKIVVKDIGFPHLLLK